MGDEKLHQDMPLTDILAAIGWKHEPAAGPNYRHEVRDADGRLVGTMTAHETTVMLRARGIITWPKETP